MITPPETETAPPLIALYGADVRVSLPLSAACRELAGVCDGAVARDNVGFNGPDSTVGHKLAELPAGCWTVWHTAFAHDMLRKYSGQLADHNIAYNEMPIPEPPPALPKAVMAGLDGRYWIFGGYYEQGDARAWEVRGSRYESAPIPLWSLPRSRAAYAFLYRLVSEYGYVWLRDKVELPLEAQDREPASEPIKPPGRIELSHDGAQYRVYFAYDPLLVSEVKQIPSARFHRESETDVWWEVGETPQAEEALLGFASAHPDFVGANELPGDIAERRERLRKLGIAAPPAGRVEVGARCYRVYFEYNPDLVAEVKAIPTARFHRESETDVWWEVGQTPDAEAGLLAFIAAHPEFSVPTKLETWIAGRRAHAGELGPMSAADAAGPLEVPGLHGSLRPFQWAGVRYIMRARRALLGDDMGLGKTLQALTALVALDALPALVVCPASAKLNWGREAGRWFPELSVKILSGLVPKPEGYAADLIVLNYDILRTHADAITANVKLNAVVFDEAHYIKGSKSQRTQAAVAVARGMPLRESKSLRREEANAGVPVRLALSGTPFKNRPAELIPILDMLGRLDHFGGFWHFVSTYNSGERESYRALGPVDEAPPVRYSPTESVPRFAAFSCRPPIG